MRWMRYNDNNVRLFRAPAHDNFEHGVRRQAMAFWLVTPKFCLRADDTRYYRPFACNSCAIRSICNSISNECDWIPNVPLHARTLYTAIIHRKTQVYCVEFNEWKQLMADDQGKCKGVKQLTEGTLPIVKQTAQLPVNGGYLIGRA